MRAGKLRNKLTIERPLRKRNAFGENEITWQQIEHVYAEVKPTSGKERYGQAQVQHETSHLVTMRYTKAVTPDCRLRFGERLLNIVGISNTDEQNAELVLQCQEQR